MRGPCYWPKLTFLSTQVTDWLRNSPRKGQCLSIIENISLFFSFLSRTMRTASTWTLTVTFHPSVLVLQTEHKMTSIRSILRKIAKKEKAFVKVKRKKLLETPSCWDSWITGEIIRTKNVLSNLRRVYSEKFFSPLPPFFPRNNTFATRKCCRQF